MTDHPAYLLVKITDPMGGGRITNLAKVRTALHDAAEEHGVSISDIVTRPGIFSEHGKSHYGVVRDLFEDTMAKARARAARLPQSPRQPSPERKAEQHRRRALRALSVVEGYIAEHGNDLGRRLPH